MHRSVRLLMTALLLLILSLVPAGASATPPWDTDSPLAMAAAAGDIVLISDLIEQGVDVNDVDSEGRTALMWAVASVRIDVAEVLLDAGEPAKNVPASFSEQGDEVLDLAKDGEHFLLRVRKKN